MISKRTLFIILLFAAVSGGFFFLLNLTIPELNVREENDSFLTVSERTADSCFVQLASQTNITYTSNDASAIQMGIDVAVVDDLVKIAGTCVGVQSRAGMMQTIYITQAIQLEGGYAVGSWDFPTPSLNETILDADGNGRLLYSPNNISVELAHLTLLNGTFTGNGGAIYNGGILTGSNLIISNSLAIGSWPLGSGGAIYSKGDLYLADSEVINGVATNNGGNIYNDNGTVSLQNSLLEGGSAFNGGAIYNWQGSVYLNQVIIDNNIVSQKGGGIYNRGPLTAVDTVFSNNQSKEGGGLISWNHTQFNRVHFLNNQASQNGGGFFNWVTTDVNHSFFQGNSALLLGGAIATSGEQSLAIIRNTEFVGNSARDGGGLHNDVDGHTRIYSSQFISNTADIGGAIVHWSTRMSMTDTLIEGNVALLQGGGLYSRRPTHIVRTTFANNQAANGGGIYGNGSAILNLYDSTIWGNSVTGDGGGIQILQQLNLNSSTISGNQAGNRGGGIAAEESAILFLLNSSISGNQAFIGGGIADRSVAATIDITATTIVSNVATDVGRGGGLDLESSVANIGSSVLALNSPLNFYNNGFGIINSQGYNLESGTDAGFVAVGDWQNEDPLLASLNDNGGYSWSHHPLAGSNLINQIGFGVNGCGSVVSVDQRGVNRPDGGSCDIGAVETAVCLLPDSPIITIVESAGNILLSWEAAINAVAYEIWEGVDAPYFNPAGFSCAQPADGYQCHIVSGLNDEPISYLGDASENSYYQIRSRNGCGDVSAVGNHVAEFDYLIIKGE